MKRIQNVAVPFSIVLMPIYGTKTYFDRKDKSVVKLETVYFEGANFNTEEYEEKLNEFRNKCNNYNRSETFIVEHNKHNRITHHD